MIKIKRKNYIQEKAQERFDSGNIGSSTRTISLDRFENKWRAKFNQKNYLTITEDNYQINQILKNFQSNKDQIKGFSSKYIQQLSDLLGQKDKNFTKKRLALYTKRIKKMKPNINDNQEKYILKTYNSLSNINSKLNKMFHSKKSDSVSMLFNERYKKSQSHNYNKTLSIFPINSKSDKLIFSKSNSKNSFIIKRNKVNESNTLTQLGFNEDDDSSYDNLNKGKEEFLMNGDREKYQEYLKREYNFFNNNDINQTIFLNEKNKRIRLFKSVQNEKYLEKRKKVSFKDELINKIFREKSNKDLILSKFIISKKLKKITKPVQINNKQNFYEDYKKIYLNIKKSLM